MGARRPILRVVAALPGLSRPFELRALASGGDADLVALGERRAEGRLQRKGSRGTGSRYSWIVAILAQEI